MKQFNLEPDYVSFEVSKYLSFEDFKISKVYNSTGVPFTVSSVARRFKGGVYYPRAEQWMVCKFLKEKYGIFVTVDVDCRDFFETGLIYFFRICDLGNILQCLYVSGSERKFYESSKEAYDAAFEYVFQNIITNNNETI